MGSGASLGATRSLRGRILRLAALAVVLVSAGTLFDAYDSNARRVLVDYQAPAGKLTVSMRDVEGALLRRVEFSPGAERAHEVDLPRGAITFEVTVGEQAVRRVAEVRPETERLTVSF